MSASKLDQLVKGAPPPNVSPAQVAESAKAYASTNTPSKRNSNPITAPVPPHTTSTSTPATTDPRDNLPSSPPQIYLNLLILESSLRLQYLSLRARLRLHLLLLTLLTAWIVLFTWLLFLRPREDGSGVGGSVYWVVESVEKLGWCGGVVTLGLFWGTGMYERGVRWPRKFVGRTNRGLRTFNLKVVVVKGGFLDEVAGWVAVLDPLGWFRQLRVEFLLVPRDIEAAASTATTGQQNSEKTKTKDPWNTHASRHGLIEEDIAPSGDVLKLLLLPKPFSPDFREGWENYRTEYWERENSRRAELRRVVRTRRREVARREGWVGWRWWRAWGAGTRRERELARLALVEKPERVRGGGNNSSREMKIRRREAVLGRAESHSRGSSRSSTPTPSAESSAPSSAEGPGTRRTRTAVGADGVPVHVRRGSGSATGGSGTSGSASSIRRPRREKSGLVQSGSRLSATETSLRDGEVEVERPRLLTTRDSLNRMGSSDAGSGVEGEEAAGPGGSYGRDGE